MTREYRRYIRDKVSQKRFRFYFTVCVTRDVHEYNRFLIRRVRGKLSKSHAITKGGVISHSWSDAHKLPGRKNKRVYIDSELSSY